MAQNVTSAPPATKTNPIDPDLFEAGPPRHLERRLHLVTPSEPRFIRTVLLFVLVTWLPLLILAVIRGLIAGDASARSFFYDVATQARFLVVLPIFAIAERTCLPRLSKIIHHIPETDLVRAEEMPRFEEAAVSTRRLLDSPSVELLMVIAAYGVAVAVMSAFDVRPQTEWQVSPTGAPHPAFSFAGWWYTLVSLPLLLVVILGWLWRILLWWRLQWLISKLHLRLMPGHPDRCGGLKFLSFSLAAFRPVALGIGASVGGVAANRIIHFHESVQIFKAFSAALVIAVIILFAGPLLVYRRVLRRARRKGMFEYGTLAGEVGRQFEKKWLEKPINEGALDVPDFSSTVDLYGVVANVYEMKEMPFSVRDLGMLIVPALLPLLPAAMLVMPVKEVFEALLKLVR